jgi:DNA-directed RNA polymerase subunit RPC12/RpoP
MRLVCAECGRESPPDAAGWRAYLDDDGKAVTFCPECAAREFSG